MNLYLIEQDENNNYDTYDAAVVAAESEEEARSIHPLGSDYWSQYRSTWCSSPDKVTVKFLCYGYEGESGIVLASFNAG